MRRKIEPKRLVFLDETGLNPLEEIWSKLKRHLRHAAARTTERLHQALTDAFDHSTTNNIEGWRRHSGLSASQK